jgi:flagellar M-ring protein FliF
MLVGIAVLAVAIGGGVELAGPPYVVLSDGLTPANGGKVIAELQKLGIPYKLEQAGNVIAVPDDMLGQARLELGDAQIPQSGAQDAVNALVNAPLTASDLAQQTLATRALEQSISDSIMQMNGVQSAQVFVATPDDTPFLQDSPKPSASVIIGATDETARADAQAIANLISGAVPGISPDDISIQTLSGTTVFPVSKTLIPESQIQVTREIEADSQQRITALLTPILGADNFRVSVLADVDFSQVDIHQVSYGPGHDFSHLTTNSSVKSNMDAAYGIPGALSNEPPGQTSTTPPPPNGQGAQSTASAGAAAKPANTDESYDQLYLNDERETKITNAPWALKSLSVSIVINTTALGNGIKDSGIKSIIASSFSNEPTTISVYDERYQLPKGTQISSEISTIAPSISQPIFELLAVITILFGIVRPAGKKLYLMAERRASPEKKQAPQELQIASPAYPDVKSYVSDNIPGVARILQSWVDEND